MSSPRFTILAFGFAALLIMPVADQLLGLSNAFKSTENRRTGGMPVLHFPHVNTFIRQFDQYYKENFGWRNALFYAYSRWKYRLLGESPLPEKVVVGKNGWHYLGNSYNNVVDQHRNLYPLSADSARIITSRLLTYQRDLAKQGIRFYVMIAPDSHSIYPENLPDNVAASAAPSRLDVFKQYLTSHTTIPLVDIRDTLIAAKKDHVVYYQTDTHWNDYGTLIGCAALLNRIRQDMPAIPVPFTGNYAIKQMRGAGGDLVQMLTLQEEVKDSVFYEIKPAPVVSSTQTATVPNDEYGFPSLRFVGTAPDRPKLLFIGDSFSHSMTQFLPGYFREAYFVRSSHLNPALVQTEKPDIVVVEIVERNISWLKAL
ncbi:alginate O-acetyltransferase AlgX-related protein [Arsenicibacter rosenii]|uniref:AlgX/AlgJ SGNH hydrolase-like domain-containing protein n=1 Tax=Arsenicibacter rosenii TaxID=1750698 RepID=A0A1S2VDF7_9BACT|nr:hypothetical protein [Arsenicibacter rosenii]OIN56732.1 hypothetical protein BLX24_23425 [Arsenicibacter rosenii]